MILNNQIKNTLIIFCILYIEEHNRFHQDSIQMSDDCSYEENSKMAPNVLLSSTIYLLFL